MKRQLIFILSIILLVNNFSFSVVASNNSANITMPYEEDALLSAMDIMPLISEPGKLITRAEFVNAVMRIITRNGGTKSGDTPQGILDRNVFIDVDGNSAESYNINYAYDLGIIRGTSHNVFSPSDSIKIVDGLSVILKALGYTDIISPNITLSAKLRLINGIDNNGDESRYMTEAEARVLLYNMMYEYRNQPSIYNKGNSVTYEATDRIVLHEIFNVYEHKGVLVSSRMKTLKEIHSIDDELVVETEVSSTRFKGNGKDYSQLVGQTVIIYYKEVDGEYVTVHVNGCTKENAVVDIEKRNIRDFDLLRYYVTYNEETIVDRRSVTVKEKRLEISKTATVLINGLPAQNFREALETLNGGTNIEKVRFIDNNADNKIDVVEIRNYSLVTVSLVDVEKKRISDYIRRTNLSLNESDYRELYVSIRNVKGEEIAIGDIAIGNTLSVFESGDDVKIFDIIVSDKSIDGKVLSKKRTNENVLLNINGEEYYAVETEKNSVYAVDIGSDMTFYFDHTGKIFAAGNKTIPKDRFAIFVGALYGSFGDVTVKMFSQNGEMVYKKFASKCIINDETFDKTKVKFDSICALLNGKLIDYTMNADGEIRSIKTASTTRGNNVLAYSWGQISSDDKYTVKMRYKSASGIFYHEGSDNTTGMLAVNKNTILFYVPEYGSTSTDEKYYKIGKISDLKSEDELSIEGYSLTESSFVSDILVVFGSSDEVTTIPGIVEEVSEIINDSGDVVVEISCYVGTNKVSYITESDTVVDANTGLAIEVSEGDIIRVKKNSLGACTGVIMLYDFSVGADSYIDSGNYGDEYRWMMGSVYSTDGEFCYVVPPEFLGGTDPLTIKAKVEIHNIKRPVIYIVDTDGNIEKGSAADIKGYTDDNTHYTKKMFVYTYWGQPSAIYVYE